jgi:6-phosphogluconolactonase
MSGRSPTEIPHKELYMFRINHTILALTLAIAALPAIGWAHSGDGGGEVFVMTNAADHNEVIAYQRHADGSLSDARTFSTGGRGSGGATDPLGSQGSLTLASDHSFLLAVNAGSGDISVFFVFGNELILVSKTPCGGSEPVAVAEHNHLVYVANAGGTSNVTGFYLGGDGSLSRIPSSTKFLTTANSGASSLSFSPDGHFLLVTEKLTNNIDAFHVHGDGTLSSMVVNPNAGPGLFGVLFAPNGAVLTTATGPTGASDASTISSYAINSNGTLTAVSPDVPTDANATCWHVVTPDGRFVFTSNPGSGTISGFSLGAQGRLTPIDGTILATLPEGSANLDVAISADGKFLYTTDSGTGKVSVIAVNADATLTVINEVGAFPPSSGFNGIAAF